MATAKPNRLTTIWMFAVLCLMSAAGLAQSDTDNGSAGDNSATSRSTATRGPVVATLEVSPAAAEIGDEVTLTLEVRAEKDVELLLPEFGEFLGQYSIVDFVPKTEIDANGALTATQSYTLQVLRSGEQQIAPILIEFVDRRVAANGASQAHKTASIQYDTVELLTEPVRFKVSAVSPDKLQAPLAPPLGQLAELNLIQREPVASASIALLFLALALAGAWWWLRRKQTPSVESAHARALERLARLRQYPRENEADIDAFFVELSGLVRTYVEDRFGLHAPELTTEEFLISARDTDQLAPADREFLGDLLIEADQVKFAHRLPVAGTMDATLSAVAAFLARTGGALEAAATGPDTSQPASHTVAREASSGRVSDQLSPPSNTDKPVANSATAADAGLDVPVRPSAVTPLAVTPPATSAASTITATTTSAPNSTTSSQSTEAEKNA